MKKIRTYVKYCDITSSQMEGQSTKQSVWMLPEQQHSDQTPPVQHFDAPWPRSHSTASPRANTSKGHRMLRLDVSLEWHRFMALEYRRNETPGITWRSFETFYQSFWSFSKILSHYVENDPTSPFQLAAAIDQLPSITISYNQYQSISVSIIIPSVSIVHQ